MNNSVQYEHGVVDNESATTPNTSDSNNDAPSSEPKSVGRYVPPHLRGHNNKPYVALKSDKYEKTIVQTHGDDVPAPIQRYEDLNLGYILPNIAPMYDALTPIQKHAMPIILEGRDLVALAQTGNFVFGLVCKFSFSLILCFFY